MDKDKFYQGKFFYSTMPNSQMQFADSIPYNFKGLNQIQNEQYKATPNMMPCFFSENNSTLKAIAPNDNQSVKQSNNSQLQHHYEKTDYFKI